MAERMSSFPKAQLCAHPSYAGLLCSLCGDLPRHPRMGDCEHVFCDVCLEKWLTKATRCPACSHPITPQQVSETGLVLHGLYENVELYCLYKNRGCPEQTKFADYSAHLENCDWAPQRCFHAECEAECDRRDLLHHMEICDHKVIPCTRCEGNVKQRDWDSHNGHTCPEIELPCELCKEIIRGKNRTHHLEEICQQATIACPFRCGASVLRCELADHLKQSLYLHTQRINDDISEMKVELASTSARLSAADERVRVLQKENEFLLRTQGKILLQLQGISLADPIV
eukprot:NODE_2998_length_1070_cov_30.190010_g2750_i0.p1 GENE.NODE_2998_length_1070_cov_30.190010_g2750_i0~~NODE_2998_length_1070_cov_30.190010_g2750_i0.p1  ORF type:complete len:285 (+),score=29.12 NODE_2998_length_1070_cov_30.190010_g2750_i0:74-928(+)